MKYLLNFFKKKEEKHKNFLPNPNDIHNFFLKVKSLYYSGDEYIGVDMEGYDIKIISKKGDEYLINTYSIFDVLTLSVEDLDRVNYIKEMANLVKKPKI